MGFAGVGAATDIVACCRVWPPSVESSFLAVRIECIPIIGYTAGLERRQVRPSREQSRRARRHGQRRCGVVRSSRSERARGAGTRASPRPNEPDTPAGLMIPRAHERTQTAVQSERIRDPQDSWAFRHSGSRTGGAEPAQAPSGSVPSISRSMASTAALSGARSWLTIRQTRASFTRG
jgi:hypothetical protein